MYLKSIIKRALKKLLKESKRFAYFLSYWLNYYLNNYKNPIWIIGDGRSGTTWLTQLINHKNKYRIMYEPFHTLWGLKLPSLTYQVSTKTKANVKLEKNIYAVLTGRLNYHIHRGPENFSFLYKGLLVKDVWANLIAYHATKLVPSTNVILIIRNPFAVALSKYKSINWGWGNNPLDMINERGLCKSFLAPYETLIKQTAKKKDFILNQLLIWSILNFVPLSQFKKSEIHIAFYEEVYLDPNKEITKIKRYVNPKEKKPYFNINTNIIKKTSWSTFHNNTFKKGATPFTAWKKELSPYHIKEGRKILKAFGFHDLYDENGLPNRKALDRIHRE